MALLLIIKERLNLSFSSLRGKLRRFEHVKRAHSCASMILRNGDLLLALFLAITIVMVFFPGLMTFDSFVLWLKAVSDNYSGTGKPPIMAFLWHQFGSLEGMLYFHNVLFWSGTVLVARYMFRRLIFRMVTIVALGFFPSILCQLGIVWLDVSLSVSLFLCCALLLHVKNLHNGRAIGTLAAIFLLMLYGLGVRLNSLPAVLPLCLWFTTLFTMGEKRLPTIVTVLLGFMMCGLLYTASSGFNRMLQGSANTQEFQRFQIYDLIAISLHQRESMLPAYMATKNSNLETLRIRYGLNADRPYPYVYGRVRPLLARNDKELTALRTAWKKAVLANIGVYLSHRMTYFKPLMGLGIERTCEPYAKDISPNKFKVKFHPSFLFTMLMKAQDQLRDTVLFRGWLYVILCLIVPILAWLAPISNDAKKQLTFIGASGFLYGTCYFFYAPSCDFRYLYWTVMAAVLAVFLFVAQLCATRAVQHTPG